MLSDFGLQWSHHCDGASLYLNPQNGKKNVGCCTTNLQYRGFSENGVPHGTPKKPLMKQWLSELKLPFGGYTPMFRQTPICLWKFVGPCSATKCNVKPLPRVSSREALQVELCLEAAVAPVPGVSQFMMESWDTTGHHWLGNVWWTCLPTLYGFVWK